MDPKSRYTFYNLEITGNHNYGTRTNTFTMRPETKIPFTAGQYVHLVAPGPEYSKTRVRHMSIASSPNDSDIVFSMNTDSNTEYKRIFRDLQPGDQVQIFKIRGYFTLSTIPEGSELVFIAGGIGITPIRGIIRQIEQEALYYPWKLIHVGNEHLYSDELMEFGSRLHLINRSKLSSTITDTAAHVRSNKSSTYFMISGSNVFVNDIRHSLILNGIPYTRILTENFTK